MSLKSFVKDYALTCYTFEGHTGEDRFVAQKIFQYMRGKRVLDLGCGPVVAVTSVFYPEAKEVVGVDRLQANLDFVKKQSHVLDTIIQRAKKYRQRYLSSKIISPRIRLVKGDVTKRVPGIGTFDSVMNMGCFGALDSEEQFQQAVNHAYAYLKKGGTLLMVNWVSPRGNARPHRFNGKVYEPDIYVPSLKKAGFTIQELHITSTILSQETRDMGYESIIWAVAKK